MITVKQVETEEEYQAYIEIRRKVFIEEQRVSEREEFDEFEKEATHFLAFYKKEPAATGRTRKAKNFIKIERVATLEKFRGKGIASKLMLEMQKVAQRDYPTCQMIMHAQTEAIPFYLKLGWTPIGDYFFEANIKHQVMVFPTQDNTT